MELVFGIIAIVLPILVVLAIALHQKVVAHWFGFMVFSVLATFFVLRFMENLTEVQLALFGVLFAFSVVGISTMFSGSPASRFRVRSKGSMDDTAQELVDSLNRARRQ